jgi:hypothetical protein
MARHYIIATFIEIVSVHTNMACHKFLPEPNVYSAGPRRADHIGRYCVRDKLCT